MEAAELLGICHAVVDAVEASLAGIEDPAALGGRPGQYALDIVADRAALAVLDESGIGVLSEESGLHRPGERLVAVLDPVDGSTNASRGLPWYATSICIVEGLDLLVSVVANLATKERYHALRGEGAYKDGQRIKRSSCTELRHAVVAAFGIPGAPSRLGAIPCFRSGGSRPLCSRRRDDGRVRYRRRVPLGTLGLSRGRARLYGSRRTGARRGGSGSRSARAGRKASRRGSGFTRADASSRERS